MMSFVHSGIQQHARSTPEQPAVLLKSEALTYRELWQQLTRFAAALDSINCQRNDRIAVYLPKQFETVITLFGASLARCVFVPINPVLKAKQVSHILKDCNATVLVTSAERALQLRETLADCTDLEKVILSNKPKTEFTIGSIQLHLWDDLLNIQDKPVAVVNEPPSVDADMAAILYTSGSTGKPKGVVLSHRNIVAGAESVSNYLNNSADDKLLAVLPLSFDYGLSQLTTAFLVGAQVALMDYLLPRDVIKAVVKHQITGLAAVPSLWKQLANLDWPEEAKSSLRYITNSGGHMPASIVKSFQDSLPDTAIYLMYGLTEAFRSTYLPPDEIDQHPGSMGKAIPNVEVMVVRPDGSECDIDEPGELVHRGVLVAMGYWNDAQKTAERFKPAPGKNNALPLEEIAVWSGDQVKRDAEGYLYFITRQDEMIKTSGYRVSPDEVEEEIQSSGLVIDLAVFGLPHPMLGQGIVVVAEANPKTNGDAGSKVLLRYCQQNLPNFMVPHHIEWLSELPRNPNGKIDRNSLKQALPTDLFEEK